MYYTGLDIHKKFIYGTVLNDQGKVINQGKFSTTEKDLDNFLGFLPNKQVSVVLESCGIWEDFYDLLLGKGYLVKLANPIRVKAIASARIKNDKIDSETLARLLKADLIPESYVPPKEIRKLRASVRHRKILVRQRTKIKNHIHAVLRKANLKTSINIFTKKGMLLLKALKDQQIDCYVRILKAIDAEINQLEKELAKNTCLFRQVKLLQTMPGVGRYSAQVICAEIGDIKRFPEPAKLCNYAGIIPSQSQSGESDYKGRITKLGSRDIRWIIVQCAHVTIALKGKLQAYYYRLCKRMQKCKAVVAVARKMLVIIWHMLTNSEVYREA
jgi:transposase